MTKKRDLILSKSNGHCWYCGCDLTGKKWQADHFHPVIRIAGEMQYPELDVIDNLVPSCAPCNNFKHSNNIEGYRGTIREQFINVPKYSTGARQLLRMGLISMDEVPVTFWFERNNKPVPSELDLIGISKEAELVEWIVDKTERSYYYQWFGDVMVTLRHMGDHWLAIAIRPDWDTGTRSEFPNSRHAKLQAAEWAIRLTD